MSRRARPARRGPGAGWPRLPGRQARERGYRPAAARPRRLVPAVAVAAAAAAVAVLVTIALPGPRPAGGSHRDAPRRAGQADRRTGGWRFSASLAPAHGAYLGAYVQPARYSQAGQIAAFLALERRLGRPLQVVHAYHRWGSRFPTAADRYFADRGKILLLTWGGDPDTRAIIAGRDNAMIAATARAIKALHHPVMLEFRHEMDRPNLQWTIHGPADYIAAWDHIRAIFTAAGASNVNWVWCPTGHGFQTGRARAFYPGDSEVDWVCADVYSAGPRQSLRAAAAPFLSWASRHDKPVIIGEFAPGGNPGGWAGWLTAAGQLARSDRQVRAMVYFDANGIDSSGNAFAYWLGNRPAALSAFARLLAQPYFRPAVPR